MSVGLYKGDLELHASCGEVLPAVEMRGWWCVSSPSCQIMRSRLGLNREVHSERIGCSQLACGSSLLQEGKVGNVDTASF